MRKGGERSKFVGVPNRLDERDVGPHRGAFRASEPRAIWSEISL
jgi:hypothetical protein